MSTEDMSLMRASVLAHVAAALEELGYATRLAQDELPAELSGPVLLTTLSPDGRGRERQATWMFLPMQPDEDFDYLSLLHYYAELPFHLPNEARPRVEAQLLILNNQLPIGHLGISPSGKLYHRYVLATSKWQRIAPQTLQQLLAVLEYTQDTFAPQVEGAI